MNVTLEILRKHALVMYSSSCHGDPSYFFGQGIVNERWGLTCMANIWNTLVKSFFFFPYQRRLCFYFKLNLVKILSSINGGSVP